MGNEWKEVARLGDAGDRYPHILADEHGWCLRLGSRRRFDDKYYASLPCLLRGLLEHGVRRRLMGVGAVLDLHKLILEMKDALETGLSLCSETLKKGGLQAHQRRAGAMEGPGTGKERFRLLDACARGRKGGAWFDPGSEVVGRDC